MLEFALVSLDVRPDTRPNTRPNVRPDTRPDSPIDPVTGLYFINRITYEATFSVYPVVDPCIVSVAIQTLHQDQIVSTEDINIVLESEDQTLLIECTYQSSHSNCRFLFLDKTQQVIIHQIDVGGGGKDLGKNDLPLAVTISGKSILHMEGLKAQASSLQKLASAIRGSERLGTILIQILSRIRMTQIDAYSVWVNYNNESVCEGVYHLHSPTTKLEHVGNGVYKSLKLLEDVKLVARTQGSFGMDLVLGVLPGKEDVTVEVDGKHLPYLRAWIDSIQYLEPFFKS